MRIFKLSILFIFAALFLAACNRLDTPEQVYNEPYQTGTVEEGFGFDDEEYARKNLDLQAVGTLLEKADSAEEFEYMLNDPEYGVNNLDLNDDGYVDYISVREFGNDQTDERGFSLFSQFGPELIQEIASIFFDRDRYDDGYQYYPGSRVLIRGDEDLYGDNYYYETNWLERTVPIVTWVFSDRQQVYNSPYYYEYYPDYYEPYQRVETVVYRERIEPYYATPVFVYTAQPTVSQIEIVSPYRNRSVKDVYQKLPKLKPEKVKYQKNPGPPEFVREKQAKMKEFREKREKMKDFKENRQFKENPNRPGKPEKVKPERPEQMREKREKPNKPERQNIERQNPVKFERPNQQRPQQSKVERQKPMRMEQPRPQPQMKQQKQENRVQPNRGGGNPNKGGGNPNKGGGNPNKGGGKGKGKP